jgi:hypothetical protein
MQNPNPTGKLKLRPEGNLTDVVTCGITREKEIFLKRVWRAMNVELDRHSLTYA